MTDRLHMLAASNGLPLRDFPPVFLLSIPLRKNNGETSNVEIVVTVIIINSITEQFVKFILLGFYFCSRIFVHTLCSLLALRRNDTHCCGITIYVFICRVFIQLG